MSRQITDYLYQVIDLREGTDVKGTIDSIRNGITIRGYNIWILACGALIASIGLDQDSPAVIIGAMLISPLMSPILGVGLSVGINDRDTLAKSLENFAIAVVASLGMSILYFMVTPFGEENPSILSRTEPTPLDVGVAFFGGVAGIVAGSRLDKTNAIPGVAIATALMPPICVAGFGIANQRWEIFLGAIYLFFLNSVFIALSTYLIVRFLRFPYKEYVDKSTKRKVSRIVAAFAILLVVPSILLMTRVLERVRTRRSVNTFIEQQINNDDRKVLSYDLKPKNDSTLVLKLYLPGTYMSEQEVDSLEQFLPSYGLDACQLEITQNMGDRLMEDKTQLEQALTYQDNVINDQQSLLDSLQSELRRIEADTLPFHILERDLHTLFPELTKFSIGYTTETNFGDYEDSLTLVFLEWSSRLGRTTRKRNEQKIGAYVKDQLEVDTVKVVSQ